MPLLCWSLLLHVIMLMQMPGEVSDAVLAESAPPSEKANKGKYTRGIILYSKIEKLDCSSIKACQARTSWAVQLLNWLSGMAIAEPPPIALNHHLLSVAILSVARS